MLGSVGANGTIAIWDLDGGLGHPLPPAGPDQGHCAAFSPDGRLLAAGRADGPVALHDLEAREAHPLIDPDAATAGARCLAFAPDGRTLAVGQRDGRITLWDVATRRECRSRRGPAMPRWSPRWRIRPTARTLASSGGDRAVRLWDVATGRQRRAIADQPGMFVALAFSPDSRILALADQRNPVVRLWDLAAGTERAALHGAEGAVLALAISPDGRTLAAADYHGVVHFWDLATGRLDRPRLVHPASSPWPSRPTAAPWPPAASTAPSSSGIGPRRLMRTIERRQGSEAPRRLGLSSVGAGDRLDPDPAAARPDPIGARIMYWKSPPAFSPASCLVRVIEEPDGRFTARLVGEPDLSATSATAEQAVEQLRARLQEEVNWGRLLAIELPKQNPVLRAVGSRQGRSRVRRVPGGDPEVPRGGRSPRRPIPGFG